MITDYDQLKSAIAAWLLRGDLEGDIPTFIQLCESRLQRVLRTEEMLERSTSTVTSQYILLPEDWIKARNVQRSDGWPLEYLTPVELDKYRWEVAKGQVSTNQGPVYYSIIGEALELCPSPSAEAPVTVEMLYYRRIPALSDTTPTNWLLRRCPDIYLYGSLVHTAPFLVDDARLPVWTGLFEGAVQEANAVAEQAKMSGPPMSRRVQTF